MFAAATSFFARTQVSQNYNFASPSSGGSGSRSSTPGPNGSPNPAAPAAYSPPLNIGPWKVQSATHKVNGKRVSVWTFDKRSPEIERLNPLAKETTLNTLKAEAAALSRLRHPSILEMVEPLEETRSELVFASEAVISSLDLAIPGSGRFASLVELDEVEIQKGVLQICNGLSFMHTSAQLVHSNMCPESIIINSKGDWKISGLGLTIPLLTDGNPTRWEFPSYNGTIPAHVQRSFDYMAPEYALDEQLMTGYDMYSLGCVLYAVHAKGRPPHRTHNSLSTLREHAGRVPAGMERWDSDLQVLLKSLITRHATNRPTPSSLPSHQFFSSLPISTLNFLDRATFTTKTREEKISFMKGLTSVLDKFSQGLRTRKILPSLLEEMKDTHLLPYILPNVFAIATALSPSQFATLVLPSLKPLFIVKEPPQNMLTLLENLSMLQTKTEKSVFREQVLPLVYNALESDHAVVQERALKCVPDLCESIDYGEVQTVLFPRCALVFTKTRILTVKVATLNTFLAMVKTLDQASLTQKLVPLLSKIRTKEPAVMMATLGVQEAMGAKVDREAVATLVLPQLWAMSMGPLLNLDQFQRFMSIIKVMGDRVEREHNQYLRDSQRIEDRSSTGMENAIVPTTGGVDFESLVSRGNAPPAVKTNGTGSSATQPTSWDDDVWGSIFSESSRPPSVVPSPLPPPMASSSTVPTSFQSYSLPSSPKAQTTNFQTRPSRLGARNLSSSTFDSGPVQSTPALSPPLYPSSQATSPSFNGSPYVPATSPSQALKPNYNISLGSMSSPLASASPPPLPPSYNFGSPMQPITASPMAPPPNNGSGFATMGGMMGMDVMTPSKPGSNQNSKPSNSDFSLFDPLG